MERNGLPRRRGQDATARPARPPPRISRDRRHQHSASQDERRNPPASTQPQPQLPTGKIRTRKTGDEKEKVPDSAPATPRPARGDSRHSRHFTVSNVGTGGTLYLKPAPYGQQGSTAAAAAAVTPSALPRGIVPAGTLPAATLERAQDRLSSLTVARAPYLERTRSVRGSSGIAPSMLKRPSQGRARSHSFSTISDHLRASLSKPDDVQLTADNVQRLRRRNSSADVPSGFLDLQIPHYRLGTPRFSAHGTAYLHTSIYSNSSSGIRSSALAGGDYDSLFPAPPAGVVPSRVSPGGSTAPAFLHPSTAYLSRPALRRVSASTSSRPLHKESISPAIFDWLERNLHDPTVVQYHPGTGRVFAATPARLIAQITSPQFLDYELLADFFLTFRCFMPCRDVLEYLLARMQWAFDNNEEAGRIVRVRTFVALRHWILNYFSDDFLPNWALRKRFCDLVNGLASTLLRRPDRGGSDLNILGELKKCWRRTCALFWREPDALNTAADVDIIPGGEQIEAPAMDSVVSLPLTIRPTARSTSVFEMTKLPAPEDRNSGLSSTTDAQSVAASGPPRTQTVRFYAASIPASPMSEESLDVLSCSVPFLRHLRPSNYHARQKSASSQHPPLSGKSSGKNAAHRHKRSGSFSDALRDSRNPLHTSQPETIDVNDLPDFTFTGGLVRGILLQPSPARLYPPLAKNHASAVETPRARTPAGSISERHNRNPGVKRLVGDVRRALSSRNKPAESPVRHSRSASSSESRQSRSSFMGDAEQLSLPKPGRESPAQDLLAAVIEQSYQVAFQDILNEGQPLPEAPEAPTSDRDGRRSYLTVRHGRGHGDSHITTGSRSIVIFDDTGAAETPFMSGGLHPHYQSNGDVFLARLPRWSEAASDANAAGVSGPASFRYPSSSVGNDREKFRSQSFDERFREFLAAPDSWAGMARGSSADGRIQSLDRTARRSSAAQPEGLDMPTIQHQLRRRPGGDLKTAIHVRELETLARSHHSVATFSSLYQSRKPSAVHSRNVSDVTHRFRQGSSLRPQLPIASTGAASLALLETQHGQSNLRPSFAAQLSSLKGLPDRDSYMGIEDALMKLEGKIPSPSKSEFSGTGHDSGAEIIGVQKRSIPAQLRNIATQSAQAGRVTPDGPSPTMTETQGASIFHVSDSGGTSLDSRMGLPLTSHATASSTSIIPMASKLDKFSTTAIDAGMPPAEWPPSRHASSGVRPFNRRPDASDNERPPNSSHSHRSLLLNDNESLSDISTEIADLDDFGFRTFFFDDSHEDATLAANPFLPPPILPPSFIDERRHSPAVHITSPSSANVFELPARDADQLAQIKPSEKQAKGREGRPETRRKTLISSKLDTAAHMPFVLAFDPDIIAEQLTIIEKDALDEVDWKDLIGLNWQQNPHCVRNWVDYLKRDSSNGIDILIARFNLVVKWVISEIVLISAPRERARAITRFIQVAERTHRLHNYASLYQITLALLSSDLAGLRKTWALVAAREKQRLKELELLCQPIRNFHNLRAEMETTSPDVGCIPFIGLYTHDLMLNAQRPARIAPPIPVAQPLVNFERFQNVAAIVKSLLRLIEASAKYVFRPHPEVLSRCLWIAALEDSEIAARCADLEPI